VVKEVELTDRDLAALVMSAERRWMEHWLAGPTHQGDPIRRGGVAPDMELTDEEGNRVDLSERWSDRPALIMLWRHLGCGCGIERIRRLEEEYQRYLDAGLEVVVVAPGERERVVAYKEKYGLQPPVLADPDYRTHRAYGLSHWSREEVLYDAPDEYCSLQPHIGEAFQSERRESGRSLVDDPWMQSAEFVVDTSGTVKVAYYYNYCEDYPDPRIFETAARLATDV
jgi:peroxiredoxin